MTREVPLYTQVLLSIREDYRTGQHNVSGSGKTGPA